MPQDHPSSETTNELDDASELERARRIHWRNSSHRKAADKAAVIFALLAVLMAPAIYGLVHVFNSDRFDSQIREAETEKTAVESEIEELFSQLQTERLRLSEPTELPELENLRSDVRATETRLVVLEEQLTREVSGNTDGRPGEGPVAAELRESIQFERERLTDLLERENEIRELQDEANLMREGDAADDIASLEAEILGWQDLLESIEDLLRRDRPGFVEASIPTAAIWLLVGTGTALTYRSVRRSAKQASLDEFEFSSRRAQIADELSATPEGDLDLIQLWSNTQKRIEIYHDTVFRQSNQSFRSAQVATAIGFLVIGVCAVATIFAGSTTSALAAGSVSVVAGSLAAYIGKTYHRGLEEATVTLRAFFVQPVEFARLLAAERLIGLMADDTRDDAIASVVAHVARVQSTEDDVLTSLDDRTSIDLVDRVRQPTQAKE